MLDEEVKKDLRRSAISMILGCVVIGMGAGLAARSGSVFLLVSTGVLTLTYGAAYAIVVVLDELEKNIVDELNKKK